MKTFKVYFFNSEFQTVSTSKTGYKLAIVQSDTIAHACEKVSSTLSSISIFSVEELIDEKGADETILIP